MAEGDRFQFLSVSAGKCSVELLHQRFCKAAQEVAGKGFLFFDLKENRRPFRDAEFQRSHSDLSGKKDAGLFFFLFLFPKSK